MRVRMEKFQKAQEGKTKNQEHNFKIKKIVFSSPYISRCNISSLS